MERWDILDANGQATGKTLLRGKRLLSGQYHLVVHIWIVNSSGRLLIQKRAPHLRLMPNEWAVTSGSAVAGEDSSTAARRELEEELGILTGEDDLQYMGRLRRRNSHCDLWLLRRDVALSSLQLQEEEVAKVAWVTWAQLKEMLNTRKFHHYGRPYFQFVRAHIFGENGDAPTREG